MSPHSSPGGAGESGAACPCSTCVAPLEHNFNHLVKLSGALGLVTALFVVSRNVSLQCVKKGKSFLAKIINELFSDRERTMVTIQT